MSDKRFTKIAGGLLSNVRDLVNWGVAGDHTSYDDLKLEVIKAQKRIEAKELVAAGLSVREAAEITGVSKSTVHRDASSQNGTKMSQVGAEAQRQIQSLRLAKIPAAGTYATIVIDPPWPMSKIERDVRPNQEGFDYPTMSEEQLQEFAPTIEAIAADDCHMFMWTTQKFLPTTLRLVDHYGFRYVLTMVWHKPGGYQPTGLPQYNCEFIVYARKGTPRFIDTKGFPCCFNAPRREHSRKPDEFYDIVNLVTDGPRIDIFSREQRDGFAQYGNEPSKFAKAM